MPRGAASALRSHLDQIEQSVRDGNCTTAEQVTTSLQSRIDGLGDPVSTNLRRALSSSAERLDTLVRDQCTAASEPDPSVVGPDSAQDTSQEERGNKENTDEGSKEPKKDKQAKKEKSKEVPPGQDGGNGTTPPGQQDGSDESPGGDTGGFSP